MIEDQPFTNHMTNCPYCGELISDESFFCWYCKRKLDTFPQAPASLSASGLMGRWLWVTAAAVAAFIFILAYVLPLF